MIKGRDLHDIRAGRDDKVCVQWSHVVLVTLDVGYSEWAKERSRPLNAFIRRNGLFWD